MFGSLFISILAKQIQVNDEQMNNWYRVEHLFVCSKWLAILLATENDSGQFITTSAEVTHNGNPLKMALNQVKDLW